MLGVNSCNIILNLMNFMSLLTFEYFLCLIRKRQIFVTFFLTRLCHENPRVV